MLTIGLVGNPNSGKSTVFNALTGARQRVGNWPGVTVEKKSGQFVHQDATFEVIDLPGTYSLDPGELPKRSTNESRRISFQRLGRRNY
ncbi:MAG: hypothetical protein Ct9H300mP8_11080 [Gammaproteobacteria bacterium]|nr:MAG: hypothetical protein Ct9H300mP8_11080 [Gammaproteobacteria bacterium]